MVRPDRNRKPGKWWATLSRLSMAVIASVGALIVFVSGYAINIVTGDCDSSTDNLCDMKVTISWVLIGLAGSILVGTAALGGWQRLKPPLSQKRHPVELNSVTWPAYPEHMLVHPELRDTPRVLGRATEIHQITTALGTTGTRIVLLYGMGGFGKTTLAKLLARRTAEHPFTTLIWSSAKGGWSLDQLLRDMSLLVADVGHQPDATGREAAALAYLASNPTLLVGDNLEDLTITQEQDRIADFLSSISPAQGSRALLTSRTLDPWLDDLLSRPGGARPILVDALDEPAAIVLLRERGWHLPDLVAAPDAELLPLVNAVSRNPKLIELLAARDNYARLRTVVDALPPQINRQRDLLLEDAFARVKAIPGTLTLLQQVPIFVPDANLDALRAVCSHNLPADADFDAALDTTLNTAILSADHLSGDARYHLHPLVQDYLQAAFPTPPQLHAAAEAAHAVYFAQFAQERSDETIVANRDDLTREWENIGIGWRRAQALRLAALQAGDQQEAQRAAMWVVDYGIGLYNFINLRGLWIEGQELLAASVEAARQLGDKANECLLLVWQALFMIRQGENNAALQLCEQSLAISKSEGDIGNEAHALHMKGIVLAQQGDIVGARACFEESLALKRRVGDVQGQGWALYELGVLEVQDGNTDEARARFEEGLIFSRRFGDRQAEAWMLHKLAGLDAQAGNVAGARARYDESLRLKRLIRDTRGEADTLRDLGHLAMQENNWVSARTLYSQSVALFRYIGNAEGEASARVAFGELLCEHGELAAGLAMLGAAVTIFERLGMPRELTETRATLERFELRASPDANPQPLSPTA